jgi:hypothetical protein
MKYTLGAHGTGAGMRFGMKTVLPMHSFGALAFGGTRPCMLLTLFVLFVLFEFVFCWFSCSKRKLLREALQSTKSQVVSWDTLPLAIKFIPSRFGKNKCFIDFYQKGLML